MTPEAVNTEERNIGWRVTFAGLGINLALGILYTWSVFSKNVPEAWSWSEKAKSWPYAIACIVFSLVMVLAGRMQDKLGPRLTATIGGLLVGLGMILASLTTSPLGYMLGFGLLAGAGIGFGYASATPPAVKWFPPAKTGMIAGLVVSGFGLSSVYAAPLVNTLLDKCAADKATAFGRTFLILGIGFLVVVVVLSQLLRAPRTPLQFAKPAGAAASTGAVKKEDFTPGEMLRTWQFYMLWFLFACGAGAGLMIISKMAAITGKQAGLDKFAAIAVAFLAVGNGAGRIAAGILSDKIGRKATMFICFVLQAVLVLLISRATAGSFLASEVTVGLIAALIGANYGANLSLFPSITKDFYGLKNFGVNYGLVFTAWGAGGFVLAMVAGWVYDATKSFNFAYYCAVGILVVAAAVVFLLKAPHHKEEAA